jgi:hypothetical protein
MEVDIWLKRIWLLIGIILLLIALVGGVALLIDLVSTRHTGGPLVGLNSQPKGSDSLITQDISFDEPKRVGKTELLSIGVRVRDLISPEPTSALRIMKYSEIPYSDYQNLVNIIFTKRDGSGSYPLLDKKAFIKTVDIPSELDSLQSYNLYDISFFDTDHDGRITGKDSSQLFISDINGEHLFQVTRRGSSLIWYQKSSDRKQVYLLVKESSMQADMRPEDWPERLYAFDVSTREVSIFPQNKQTVEHIRDILWGK